MTEMEWLASVDPVAMLRCLTQWHKDGHGYWTEKALSRKFRLFACACCLARGTQPAIVDAYERYGFGKMDGEVVTDADWAKHCAEGGTNRPSKKFRAALLRCIINPFRTYAWTDIHDCSPSGHDLQFLDKGWLAWNNGVVGMMADEIYTERMWGALPVLADALDEAGCPTDEPCNAGGALHHCQRCGGTGRAPNAIIQHLRAPGPHARGCWVVDLLLGKE